MSNHDRKIAKMRATFAGLHAWCDHREELRRQAREAKIANKAFWRARRHRWAQGVLADIAAVRRTIAENNC